MSMLMKLNFILTQQPPLEKQKLLEQILPLLKQEIIHGKLSKIWVIKNNNDFISIYNNEDIEININDDIGKTLLTKIIYFIIKRIEEKEETQQHIFFFILKSEYINIRKILWNHNNNNDLKNNFELFIFMMRSFVIINQQQYENIFQT